MYQGRNFETLGPEEENVLEAAEMLGVIEVKPDKVVYELNLGYSNDDNLYPAGFKVKVSICSGKGDLSK